MKNMDVWTIAKDKDNAVDIPIHKLKLKLNLNADVTYIH